MGKKGELSFESDLSNIEGKIGNDIKVTTGNIIQFHIDRILKFSANPVLFARFVRTFHLFLKFLWDDKYKEAMDSYEKRNRPVKPKFAGMDYSFQDQTDRFQQELTEFQLGEIMLLLERKGMLSKKAVW